MRRGERRGLVGCAHRSLAWLRCCSAVRPLAAAVLLSLCASALLLVCAVVAVLPPRVAAVRVVDYFLVVGHGATLTAIDEPHGAPDDEAEGKPREAALTPGVANSPSAAAAAAAAALPRPNYLDRLYAGDVMCRFPLVDHASVPFPAGISMFCIPDSIRLTQSVSALPHLHYFAATQGDGHRLYGACLQFWEAVPQELVDQLEDSDRKAQQARTSLGGSGANGSRDNTVTIAEHSVSTSAYEAEPSVKAVSRSPSPKPASVDTSAAEPASANAVSSAASPPRPQRGLVTLSSFPAVSVGGPVSSSSTPRAASASTSGPPSTTFAGLSLTTQAMEPTTTRASSASVPASNLVAPSPSHNRFKKKGRPVVYAPKCICLLSLHPYLEQYRIFLTELYRLSLTPSLLPLERYISNFMLEVPLPPMGNLRYAYTISNRTLFFANNPPNNPLAYQQHSSGSDSRASRILTLFELLDVENILFIIECILGEKRILFLSNRLSLLTMISEIFLHLLYPFVWSHVYIPLLPKALIDFLFAPMPFIIGMHSHYVRGQLHGEMLVDLVVVDLDHNRVHFNSAAHVPPTGNTAKDAQNQPGGLVHHFLPAKERKKLKEQLKPFQALFSRNGMTNNGGGAAAVAASAAAAAGAAVPSASRAPSHQAYQLRLLDELDLAFPNAPHPDELDAIAEYAALVSELRGSEDQISLAFFRCFVSMFKDYAECLIFPTAANPAPDPCFDVKRFLKKTNEKSSEPFFTALVATQAFQRFCEERIYLDQKHALDPNTPEGAAAAAAAAAAASGRAVGQSLSPEESSRYAILFFDQSIIAKRNRSKFSKNIPTPFLEETKWDITQTVKVPEPETCGMPPPITVDAAGPLSPSASGSSKPRVKPYTFSYDHFPSQFEEKWFWGVRLQPPPPPAVKTKPDKKGANAAAATAATATTDAPPATTGDKDAAAPSASSSSTTPVAPPRPSQATRPGLARVSSLPHPGAVAGASRTLVVASPRQSINLGGAHGSLVPAGPVASTPPALIVEATWFHVLSVVASEQRSLALLQLGLGFLRRRVHEVVRARAKMQSANGGQSWNTAAPGAAIAPHLLPPCEEVFHRLMRCCGSCGAPDLAIDIFHLMLLLDEFAAVADSAQMFHALLNIFAETRDQRGFDALAKLKKVSREQLVAAVAASQPPPVSPRPALAEVRAIAQQALSPTSEMQLTTPPMSPLSVLSPHSPAVMQTPGDASGAGAVSPPQRSALSITASRDIGLSPSFLHTPQNTLTVPGADDALPVETMSPRTATSASPRMRRKLSRSVDYSSPMRPSAVASGASVRAANSKLMEHAGIEEFAATSADSVALDSLALITASAGFGSAFPAAAASASSSSPSAVSVARPADDPLMAVVHLAQFRSAFPGLTIDLVESCPECRTALSDSQVRRGWNTADGDDYTTRCAQCGERFVARFIVRPLEDAATAAGSKSPTSPAGLPEGHISCEYLPPLVLHKQLLHCLLEYGNSHLLSAAFRKSAIFWNLCWAWSNFGLTADFLRSPEKWARVEPAKKKGNAGAGTMTSSTAAAAAAIAAAASSGSSSAPPVVSSSPHSTTSTSSDSDVLSRTLGAQFSSELPLSPTTLAEAEHQRAEQARQMHAKLLAEQRAKQAAASSPSPSPSPSPSTPSAQPITALRLGPLPSIPLSSEDSDTDSSAEEGEEVEFPHELNIVEEANMSPEPEQPQSKDK